MFVRNLIGRNAGQIQEQPYHVASSNISMGTAEIVTDDEISAAGLTPPDPNLRETMERFPEGYTCKRDDVYGYLLFGPDGEQINEQPFPNLTQARSAAYNHSGLVKVEEAEVPKIARMTVAELKQFAADKGFNIATAKNKAEMVALIERALVGGEAGSGAPA